jgi:hypothetical protein
MEKVYLYSLELCSWIHLKAKIIKFQKINFNMKFNVIYSYLAIIVICVIVFSDTIDSQLVGTRKIKEPKFKKLFKN